MCTDNPARAWNERCLQVVSGRCPRVKRATGPLRANGRFWRRHGGWRGHARRVLEAQRQHAARAPPHRPGAQGTRPLSLGPHASFAFAGRGVADRACERTVCTRASGRKPGSVPQTDSSSRVQPAFIAAESKARVAGDTSVSCKQFWLMAANKFNDQDWQPSHLFPSDPHLARQRAFTPSKKSKEVEYQYLREKFKALKRQFNTSVRRWEEGGHSRIENFWKCSVSIILVK
jgi:hypothetical protein